MKEFVPRGILDEQMRPLGTFRRDHLLAAVLATFALALAFQGSRGLWEPDEGRYTIVALEMLRTGDFLHPALNHETPHYTKPPLTYWAIAGSVALFGRNEWAVRLPYALAFAFAILAVGAMGRRLAVGRPVVAGLAYGVMLLPFVAANVVTTDTLLALFETLGMACYVEARWGPRETTRGDRGWIGDPWIVAMWACFGLAFATKGPPGMMGLLVIVVFRLLDRRQEARVRIAAPLGLALFAAVAFSWFAVVLRDRPDLLGYFLGTEVIDRLVSARLDRNAQWYGFLKVYGPTLLAGTLPWTGHLGAAVADGWRGWRARGRAFLTEDRQRLLLLVWIGLPLLVFSAARSRLSLYLLPLSAPLALVVARRLAALGSPARGRFRVAVACWVLVLLALKAYAGFAPHHKDSRELARAIATVAPGPVDEIAFLDTRPRYGLGLYLDSEIEAVTVAPWPAESGALQPWEVLVVELEEVEDRVWVFPVRKRDALVAALEARGVTVTIAGRWEDLLIAVPR